MKTKEQKEKFIQLRAEGNSFDKISDILKISKPTLISWNNELQREINNLEYLKYQTILEKFKLVKLKRIEFLSKQIDKINEAIEKKSFEDISIKELVLLRSELNSELLKEIVNKKFQTGVYKPEEYHIPGLSDVETTFDLE